MGKKNVEAAKTGWMCVRATRCVCFVMLESQSFLSAVGSTLEDRQISLSAHARRAKTPNTKLHTEEGQRGAF